MDSRYNANYSTCGWSTEEDAMGELKKLWLWRKCEEKRD